jgi:hypothetical protein
MLVASADEEERACVGRNQLSNRKILSWPKPEKKADVNYYTQVKNVDKDGIVAQQPMLTAEGVGIDNLDNHAERNTITHGQFLH